jgi:site-specific recombinase XerD
VKLTDAIDKYEKYLKVTRSKGTLKYFQGKISIIKKYLGSMSCEKIDRDVILDFIIKQQERNVDLSNRTINKYVSTIKQVLKYACNIKLEFDKLPEIKKIIETVPDPVISLIYSYYQNNQSNLYLIRNFMIFRLLNETVLRLTELLNLKITDIDIDNLTIHVMKTKTNRERYVFFLKETSTLLSRYIIMSRLENYLFIDFTTGELLKEYTIESICQRLRKQLDIKQSISPHKWRHTFATRFVKNNGNMEVLRQIMGHASLRTTQKYLHIDKDALYKEYFRINNFSN